MLEARVVSCLVLAAVLQTLTTILLDSGGALGMSEAELALLNIDVFTVPWCMKVKPTMLWLSGTKHELSPWFQSLWFPSWSNFCLFFFSNSLKCDQLWEWLHFWTWASEVAACVNLALLISWERILLSLASKYNFFQKAQSRMTMPCWTLHGPQNWAGGRDYLGWDMSLSEWWQVTCGCSYSQSSRVPAAGNPF